MSVIPSPPPSLPPSPPTSPTSQEVMDILRPSPTKLWSERIHSPGYTPQSFIPLQGRVTPASKRSPPISEEKRALSPKQIQAKETLLSSQKTTLTINGVEYLFSPQEFLPLLIQKLDEMSQCLQTQTGGIAVFQRARITGSAATAILLESEEKLNDIDVNFAFYPPPEKEMKIQFLNEIRDIFHRTLSSYLERKGLPHPLIFSEFCKCLHNQVMISNEEESWSLFSIGGIDCRFSLNIQREWDFSCRSFQIDLRAPTAFCLFGNFEQALEDARLKRIRTIFPEGIYKGLERCLLRLEQGFICGSQEIYRGLLERYFTLEKGTESTLEKLIERYILSSAQNTPNPKEKEKKTLLAFEEMLTLLSSLERPTPYLSSLTSKILHYFQDPLILLRNIPDVLFFYKKHPQIFCSLLDALSLPQRGEYVTQRILPLFFLSKENQPMLYPLCKEILTPSLLNEWLEKALLQWDIPTMKTFYEDHLSTLPKNKTTFVVENLLSQEAHLSQFEGLINRLLSLGKERFPRAQDYQRLLLSWTSKVLQNPRLLTSKEVLTTLFLKDPSLEKKWVMEKVQMLLDLKTQPSQELFLHVLQKGYFGFLSEPLRLHFIQELSPCLPDFYLEKIDILSTWYDKEGSKLPSSYPLSSLRKQAMEALLQKGDFSHLILFYQKPSPLLPSEYKEEWLLDILEKAMNLNHPLTEEFVLSLLKATRANKDRFEARWLSIFLHFATVYPKSMSAFFLEMEKVTPPLSRSLQTQTPLALYQQLHGKLWEKNEKDLAFDLLMQAKKENRLSPSELDTFLPIWETLRKANNPSLSLMKRELALFYPGLFENTNIASYMTQYLTLSYAGNPLKWMEEVNRYLPTLHPLRKRILLSSLTELFRIKKIRAADALSILSGISEDTATEDLSPWDGLLSIIEPQDSFVSLSSFFWKRICSFPEEKRSPFFLLYGKILGKSLRHHAQTDILDKKLPEFLDQFPLLFSSNKNMAADLYLWAMGRSQWQIAFKMSQNIRELPIPTQSALLDKTLEHLSMTKNAGSNNQEWVLGCIASFYPFIVENKESCGISFRRAQDWLKQKPSSMSFFAYLVLGYPMYLQKPVVPIQEQRIRDEIVDQLFLHESKLAELENYVRPILSEPLPPGAPFLRSHSTPFYQLANIAIAHDIALRTHPKILEEKIRMEKTKEAFYQLDQLCKHESFQQTSIILSQTPARERKIWREMIIERSQTFQNVGEFVDYWQNLLQVFNDLLSGFTKDDYIQHFYEPLFKFPNKDLLEKLSTNTWLELLLCKVEQNLGKPKEQVEIFHYMASKFQKLWFETTNTKELEILSFVTTMLFIESTNIAKEKFFFSLDPAVRIGQLEILRPLFYLAFRKCAEKKEDLLHALEIVLALYPEPNMIEKRSRQFQIFPNEETQAADEAFLAEATCFLMDTLNQWKPKTLASIESESLSIKLIKLHNIYNTIFIKKHPVYISASHYFNDIAFSIKVLEFVKTCYEQNFVNIVVQGWGNFAIKSITFFVSALKQSSDVLPLLEQEKVLLQTMANALRELSKNPLSSPLLKNPEELQKYEQNIHVKKESLFDYFLHVVKVRFPSVT